MADQTEVGAKDQATYDSRVAQMSEDELRATLISAVLLSGASR